MLEKISNPMRKKIMIGVWAVVAVVFSGIGTKYLPELLSRLRKAPTEEVVDIDDENQAKPKSAPTIIASGELPYLEKLPILDKGLFAEYHYNDLLFGGVNIGMIKLAARQQTGEAAKFEKDETYNAIVLDITEEPYMEFSYKGKYYSLSVTGAHYIFKYELSEISETTMVLNSI